MKTNINHIWSLICSQSSIDHESNNVSLHNTIEKVTFNVPKEEYSKVQKSGAKGLMLGHQFEIVSRFDRESVSEPEVMFYRISMVNPKGETMITNGEQEIRFEKNMKNMRIRNRFDSLPIEGTGDYGFKIETKNLKEDKYKTVYTIPLELILNLQ